MLAELTLVCYSSNSKQITLSNVCFIKIRTTHKSIFINIFGLGLLYCTVYLVLKVLTREICNIELEFAKKVIIKSQITITFLSVVRIFMRQAL